MNYLKNHPDLGMVATRGGTPVASRGVRGMPPATRGVVRGRGASPMMATRSRGMPTARGSPQSAAARGRGSSAAQLMQQGRGGMAHRGSPQAVARGRGSSAAPTRGAISITHSNHVREGLQDPYQGCNR